MEQQDVSYWDDIDVDDLIEAHRNLLADQKWRGSERFVLHRFRDEVSRLASEGTMLTASQQLDTIRKLCLFVDTELERIAGHRRRS